MNSHKEVRIMDPTEEVKTQIMKGWEYVRKEQFEQANEAFIRATDLDPNNRESLFGRTLCLRKTGKYPEAQRILDELKNSSVSSGDLRLFEEQILLYIDQQQYDKAVEVFIEPDEKDAGKVRWRNKDVLLRLLALLRSQLSFGAVEELINAALRRDHDYEVLCERAWLYYTRTEYSEAVKIFDEVLEANNTYAPAIQGKIASLRLQRNFTEADKQLQEVIGRFPEHLGIQSEKGWLYFDQNKYGKAFEVFNKVHDKGDKSALKWMITCLRKQFDFTKAETWIHLALAGVKEDDPDWIGIQNEKGWLHFDKKHYDEALKDFNKALEIDDLHEFALQGKIASLRKLRRFSEVKEEIDRALTRNPNSIGILSELGWLHFEQKQYAEADAAFKRAIELAPNRLDLKFSRVEVLCNMNRSREAKNILDELKAKLPDDLEVLEQLGKFYIRRNDLQGAESTFDKIIKKDGDSTVGLNGLGAVYLKKGYYKRAEIKFREIINMNPHNSVWHSNLAWSLVRQETGGHQGRLKRKLHSIRRHIGGVPVVEPLISSPSFLLLQEAEQECQEALKYDPDNASAYLCLGTIAFKQGKLLDSEEFLLTSTQKDQQAGGCVGLGALYVRMGRHDAAKNELKKALENDPHDASAHFELGNLHLQIGETWEAIKEFRHAMACDPNDDDSARALAITLMQADEAHEAEEVLHEAIRRLGESPKRWRLYLLLSQVLTQKGDESEDSHFYTEAIKEVKKAIAIKRNLADPYFHAGIIEAKRRNFKQAHKYFQLCLQLDPKHYEAEQNDGRVRTLIKKERSTSFWGGFFVGSLAVLQLVLLWYFFTQGKVTETILTVLLPILLGLVVVATVIPVLIKLKLPGLEAELSDRKESIVSGLKDGIGFSSSPPSISSGPR